MTDPQNEAALFGAMRAAFDRAASAGSAPARATRLALSGAPVDLNIAGSGLAEQIRLPFHHLLTDASTSAPALTIEMWDQDETGVAFEPPTVDQELGPYGFVTASEDGRYAVDRRRESLGCLDRWDNRIVWCTKSPARMYLDERARPLHRLLSIWLRDRGVQFVHAGLVARGDQGVLFVGAGGSGKTTSSIACLCGGLGYLGDDFIGLEAGAAGQFMGHGLYATCLVEPDHLQRFPDLKAHATAANHASEDKSVIYLSRLFPEGFLSSVAIRGIVMPRVIGSGATRYRAASRKEALLSLAPSSIMMLPGANKDAMILLGNLVEALPSFWLELGQDIAEIPGCVEHLVQEVAA